MAHSASVSSVQQEKRVVMVGCTGHGKGTLGNFLYNLGQRNPNGPAPLFQESGKMTPDTQNPYIQRLEIQNSPNAPEARKAKRFVLLDTPGLNDVGRDKDLKHMMNVIRMIGTQFGGVHSLVLVYRFKTRMDASIGPALRYYRDLFAPLFRAQNIILVLTHVSSDDYEFGLENETWDEDVKNHLNECNNLLELNTPAWNCPIVACYFVNSKWTSTRIEEFLQTIAAKKDPKKTDLLWRSYLMREQILNYISEAAEVALDTHTVSFPPALEDERKSALAVIDGRIMELLKAVRIENSTRAEQLADLEKFRTKLTVVNSQITQYNAEIAKLSAIQKTPSKKVEGDDWITVFSKGERTIEAPCNNRSPCGGCECTYKFEAHNASHPTDYPKKDEFTWKVKVDPDWFHFTQKENRYWFYRFWLEYDGERHNAGQLQRERNALSMLKTESTDYTQRVKSKEDTLKSGETQLAEHNENLLQLNNDKTILLPKQFQLVDIPGILDCMERNMQPQ